MIYPVTSAVEVDRAAPIDYAVIEYCANAVVVPCDLGWSDIGSWDQLHAIGEADASGNVLLGEVVAEDVRNSYIRVGTSS